MTAWTVIGVLWAVAIGFFFLGWLAARMASQHTRAVESRPECGCSVWPCPTCGASDQATACAVCGERKHTPIRNDAMGGYVCLTCIDRELERLQSQTSAPRLTPSAPPSMDEGDVAVGLCGNARLDRQEDRNEQDC